MTEKDITMNSRLLTVNSQPLLPAGSATFCFPWLSACLALLCLMIGGEVLPSATAQDTADKQQAEKQDTDKKDEKQDAEQKDAEKQDAEKQDGEQKDGEQADPEKKATKEKEIHAAFEKMGQRIQGAVTDTVADQLGQDGDGEEFVDEHFDGGITLDENRELKRKLDLAREQLAQGKVADTVQFLGQLQADADTKDFFLAPEDRGRIRKSFRAAVRELIGSLPPNGRESYELLFGGEARKLLEQAVTNRDWNAMNNVVRRYYHTQAGHQALYLLGSHYLDLDRPREALVCLERLKELDANAEYQPRLVVLIAAARFRAGDVTQAIADVQQLKDASPGALQQLSAGPPPADLTNAEDVAKWLAAAVGSTHGTGTLSGDWLTLRGDASRNAISAGSAPLLSSQTQEPLGTPYTVQSISAYQRAMNDAKMAVIPSLYPVVAGDNVLISTNSGLIVRSLANGQTWSYPASGADNGIEQEFWCGPAYGIPATDGLWAFLVEDHVAGPAVPATSDRAQRVRVMRRGLGGPILFNDSTGSSGVPIANSLTAIDLASRGKVKWRIGGTDGGNEPSLAGAYFLGAPLSYGGRLYVMAEFKGSIRLIALDSQTGQLEWIQELAIAEYGISDDSFRRMAGASPSVADGIIVCPTSCGGVVALDLTTQSLLWAYRYPRRAETFQNNRYGYSEMTNTGTEQGNRWVDPAAVISAGAVLITPLESDEMHCLDLRTGELRWKKPRGDKQENLFVACADAEKCIMVGRDRVVAWNLSDGKPTWKDPIPLPEGVYPAGQGVHIAGQYLLPLTNASLASVDLATGAIADTQTTRRELPLGNLVYARGQFVSIGPKFIETFPERDKFAADVQERLSNNPDDPLALTQRGELLQADGVLDEAIEHFSKAYRLEPNARRKNLLTAALLTGVRQKLPQAAEYDELLKALPVD